MQAQNQAEPTSREPSRLEYFGWYGLDRDGMERVGDWVVRVLLLLWASGPEECARQAFGIGKEYTLHNTNLAHQSLHIHMRDTRVRANVR